MRTITYLYQQLLQLGIGELTVYIFLQEDLNMRKICAKFVPRVLNDEQKDRCVGNRFDMVELINLL